MPEREPAISTPEKATRPGTYFLNVYQSFQQAERRSAGPVDRFYRIAGHAIRLRFASPALVSRISPSLEHLAVSAEPPGPALTVCLWDSASTGTDMPAPPWSWENDCIARGEVRGYNDDRIHTAYQVGSGVLSMLDRDRNLAVYWVRDARQLPFYESACPLRNILGWWMHARGLEVVHGAAIGDATAGVLIAGRGGAGKSTTCLACLHAGFFFAGDNNVVLCHEPVPTAWSLYNSATVEADNLHRLPFLARAIRNPERLHAEKALLFATDHYADRVRTSMPLRAILLPRVTGLPETRLRPATPAMSLAALAPGTMFSLPGAGRDAFWFMGRFVRKLPSYVLELGTDIPGIPRVLAALLSGK